MDHDENSAGPPSYLESVQTTTKNAGNVEDARDGPDLVHSLLTGYIIPRVQIARTSGSSSSTLVIIPSNVASLQPPVDVDAKGPSRGFSGEKVVGFPSTEELTLIRLSNREDTQEYWQDLAVKQLLRDSLHAYLVQEGYYFQEDIEKAGPFEQLTGVPSNMRRGWITSNEERLRDREASVNVSMQEICLRVEDEMGLYETKKGKALVVRLRLGREDSTPAWD